MTRLAERGVRGADLRTVRHAAPRSSPGASQWPRDVECDNSGALVAEGGGDGGRALLGGGGDGAGRGWRPGIRRRGRVTGGLVGGADILPSLCVGSGGS